MGFKRLHIYLIKGYLGTFIATFMVCLFIVLLQFLWKYVGDMVGKGLPMSVLFQFFYYAALSLVPMALPLSILLSSLMAFGNLGERLELLAMKASGISLFRIMKPYIIFITLLSVGAFFYSNMVLPAIQKNLFILTKSMAQKSPEVEIPVGSFYQGVKNVSVYVGYKDPDTKLLKDIMIYDFSASGTNASGGSYGDNVSVTCADSGRIEMSKDQCNLVLTMYSGVTFENIRQQGTVNESKSIPYRRETFSYKQLFIETGDMSFQKLDSSIVKTKQIGKNLAELTYVVDSLAVVSKDRAATHEAEMVYEHYFNRSKGAAKVNLAALGDTKNYNFEDLYEKQSRDIKVSILDDAIGNAVGTQQTIERMYYDKDYNVDRTARRHDIERHRKFTMSLACLLFFFIGAPLGAIINKGGMGYPIVISIFIFILYYVVDNSGYKLAREGVWFVWEGIWLSSAVLAPLGAFLTYKAATDSMVNVNSPTFKKIYNGMLSIIRFIRIFG